ncbi:hypothetical protein [Ruegeria sediminis]|uniref:hypothetical protein n=1 Tax=Ruegeria sediminis TaxID=2583820 RepID=UPI00148726DB|nr:hypothetical protein [Ruegeria sediminis]
MKIVNILGREDREIALVLAADRMAQVAQKPLTRSAADELRRLAAKVAELAGAA